MGDTANGPHYGKQSRQSGFGLRALVRLHRDNPAPGEFQPTPQALACQKVQDRRLAQNYRHGLDPAASTKHTQAFVGECRGGLELPVQRFVRTRTDAERLLHLRLERNAILDGWGRFKHGRVGASLQRCVSRSDTLAGIHSGRSGQDRKLSRKPSGAARRGSAPLAGKDAWGRKPRSFRP